MYVALPLSSHLTSLALGSSTDDTVNYKTVGSIVDRFLRSTAPDSTGAETRGGHHVP
jgi:hypothetical protein